MYMVITEIIGNGVERWYYGTYDYNRANEVALELGHDPEAGIYHCVIPADKAEAYEVKNLPQ